ncbi:uncharacterized protein LOC131156696 [Malania oleifera]|uniref:uncharacterized protein LOC131156696 n=1 Tax=Malania oleifera TaxID=397392 RepID=UPI0025AE16FA|nr:uncharacterized protein LOC131156696 [Malania oleifera]
MVHLIEGVQQMNGQDSVYLYEQMADCALCCVKCDGKRLWLRQHCLCRGKMVRRGSVAQDGRPTESTLISGSDKAVPKSCHPSPGGAKSCLHQNPEEPASLSSSKMKTPKNRSAILRRSARIQSAVLPRQNQDLECVIEEINGSDSEKEDGQHNQSHQTEKTSRGSDLLEKFSSELNLGARSLEEKVDYLFQQLMMQEKITILLKSEANKRSSPSHNSPVGNAKYKSLYIDSQKKIEALKDENFHLAKKLENVVGKLDAYEKMTHLVSEMLEKMKDVILVSRQTSATETAFNLSSLFGVCTSPGPVNEARPAPKRKKVTKASRKAENSA